MKHDLYIKSIKYFKHNFVCCKKCDRTFFRSLKYLEAYRKTYDFIEPDHYYNGYISETEDVLINKNVYVVNLRTFKKLRKLECKVSYNGGNYIVWMFKGVF